MSFYIIGIGGTGAKCIEALIHLCAAGVMPQGDLYTIFVDPDKANGSLDRAQVALKQYSICRQIQLGAVDLFKTNIVAARPDVWSPFSEPRPRLDSFFQYNDLKIQNESAAHLFDVLYSPDEKETPLEKGFRGHPSIGAAVMAKTLRLGIEDPWQTFRDKLRLDIGEGKVARIVLVGSIFGGTGASGIPTIARLIQEEITKAKQSEKKGRSSGSLKQNGAQAKVKVGGVLMLPYFSFNPVTEDTLKADAENFLLSTQAALNYYYQQDDLETYDKVYLLGEHSLSPMKKPSIGGNTQRNEPHFLELYAALACTDFFARENGDDENEYKYRVVGRESADRLDWQDLPYSPNHETLRKKIEQITRFAFAYLCSYYPLLDDINRNGRGYRAPWYVNLFRREAVNLAEAMTKELDEIKQYCELFLRWIANVQTSAASLDVQLVNYNAFSKKAQDPDDEGELELLDAARFATGEFNSLILPLEETYTHGLHRLWERMSDAKVRDNNANGVGKFLHALYRECAR